MTRQNTAIYKSNTFMDSKTVVLYANFACHKTFGTYLIFMRWCTIVSVIYAHNFLIYF